MRFRGCIHCRKSRSRSIARGRYEFSCNDRELEQELDREQKREQELEQEQERELEQELELEQKRERELERELEREQERERELEQEHLFMNAIKEGKLNEVEPVGDAFLNLDSVTDAFPWVHPLPKEQK